MKLNSLDKNPHAFARPHSDNMASPAYAQEGMTLRDYFAAKAISGLIGSDSYSKGLWDIDAAAKQAYEVADAMLKRR